jgi:hypothetical protein
MEGKREERERERGKENKLIKVRKVERKGDKNKDKN